MATYHRRKLRRRKSKNVIISKAAQELIDKNPNLDLTLITGTGKNGNIGINDVRKAVKAQVTEAV